MPSTGSTLGVRSTHGATAGVAAFACDAIQATTEHATHLGRAIVDTVGCAIAASGSPSDALLRHWCDGERTTGRSSVWTTGEQVSAAQAALLNGTSGHALDWDDVSPGSALHPSTVLLPALLAVGEQISAEGSALVTAHDVGAATFRALAEALPWREHYRRGWHTTSTVGRLAAVAALANLCSLDEAETRNALGLVGSLASGSVANFGTMTKSLHAGLAARDAVMAVALAADGFTANSSQLEAKGGFFDAFGCGEPSVDLSVTLGEELRKWRSDWPLDWAFKRYPACYATHRAIDAVLQLRPPTAGRLPDRILIQVEPGGLRPLIARAPETPTEAKFSMAYVVSVALIHGEVGMGAFSESAFQSVRIRTLSERVSADERDVPSLGQPNYADGYTVVALEYSDGTAIQRVDHTYGDAHNPLSDDDLDGKFADCCHASGHTAAMSQELVGVLRGLPRAVPIGALRDALASLWAHVGDQQ